MSTIWEATIAGLSDVSSRLALSVAYANYQLGQPDPSPGVNLLVTVMTTPGVPGPIEANARQLLRIQWRQHPQIVEAAWQLASTRPVPGWMHLTDDHIDTVIGWIDSGTWAESRLYFGDHSGQLLSDTTTGVLDELSLRAPEDVIGQHRGLVNAIREHGPDAAYRPLLTRETLREWIAEPSWEASRTFLDDHPELLDEGVPGLLADLARDRDRCDHRPSGPADPGQDSRRHRRGLPGPGGCAVAAGHGQRGHRRRDTRQLQACAQIETFVQARTFAGALHMILAWLLAGPLPDDWASELRRASPGSPGGPGRKGHCPGPVQYRAGQHPGRQRHQQTNSGTSSACPTDPRPGQSPEMPSHSAGGLSSDLSHSRSASSGDARPRLSLAEVGAGQDES